MLFLCYLKYINGFGFVLYLKIHAAGVLIDTESPATCTAVVMTHCCAPSHVHSGVCTHQRHEPRKSPAGGVDT